MKKLQGLLTNPLSTKTIVLTTIVFVIILVVLNQLVRYLCLNVIAFDCPQNWPLSMFMFRVPPRFYYPNAKHLIIAAATIAVFVVTLVVLSKMKYKLFPIIVFSTILVLGSNLTQGWQWAFITPTAGVGIYRNEYYNDATAITNVSDFISDYVDLQPELLTHSRTHPPGAVLIYYYLAKIFGDPAYISIFLAVISVLIFGYAFWRWMNHETEDEGFSGYLTLLLLLLPAVQIYFASSIDSIIAACMLGVLSFFIHPTRRYGVFWPLLFLVLSSIISFGVLFLVPVLLGYEYLVEKRAVRIIQVLIGTFVAYLLLFFTTGFNYIDSFIVATKLENPLGPRFLVEPVSYFATRIEGSIEIFVFLGPILSLIMLKGLIENSSQRRHKILTWLALSTLAVMLLMGVYRTGETARAALFIYPYLFIPIAVYLKSHPLSQHERDLLASLVFGQTLAMQLMGNFFW
ncbi:MAG: hypothetical protein JSV37_07770 [Anaerolineaceae bacterium]|nr:MAG: hypothetical protein JSV37_07770 [Anaerolineaceae bacterium]